MAFRLTNEKIYELVSSLGFEPGDVTKANIRPWRHPVSGCALLLPAKTKQDSPRPADLVGIQAQLDLQGHLSEEAFDLFVTDGRMPTGSTEGH